MDEKTKAASLSRTALKNMVAAFAPEGIDPITYYKLISVQVMGVDKKGQNRPTADMLFFLQTAKKLGLDPTLRQIYPVYRWDSRIGAERMIIQTGIDGLRLMAQGSRGYSGQDDAAFKMEETYNPVTNKTDKQLVATVTVYRNVGNERVPFTASARWNEYAQKARNTKGEEYYIGMWATMPYNQLAKCAEALALRKGFPRDLSGLYIPEEMEKDRSDARSLSLPLPKSVEDKKKANEAVVEKEPEAPKKVEQEPEKPTKVEKEPEEKQLEKVVEQTEQSSMDALMDNFDAQD